MWCDWCWWLEVGLVVYIVVQLLRILLSDSDLSLQWADIFGKQPSSLVRKVIWITGASSGIGEHVAYELAKSGCRLVLTARREAELNRVKQNCLAFGTITKDDMMVLPLDLTSFDLHKPAVDEVLGRFKQIDILVNNAGQCRKNAPWMTMDMTVDRELMELNLFSVLSLTRLVVPSMIERGQGHIAVMSSVSGKHCAPGIVSYSGIKHALQGYFNSLRVELYKENIKITMLCPAPILTDLLQNTFAEVPVKQLKLVKMPLCMLPERCARLCAVALANDLKEAWMGAPPSLILVYFNQWFPSLTAWLADRFLERFLRMLWRMGTYKERR